jgi:uncharacterized protein YifN (PemK superfamily)
MAINFHPKIGTVLICDFDTGFRPPEMVKKRPVIVVSRSHRQLATIVPLSTVEPIPFEKCHHEIDPASLPHPFCSKRSWAKCDLLSTVAFWRLDRVKAGRDRATGKRIYVSHVVTPQDLKAIQDAILHVLGLKMT